jgi:nitrite reductase/ring-hydroxylating ferredoxin subunit
MISNAGLTFLCTLNELPEGESRGFNCANTNVFAVRYGGSIHVYLNACPHAGMPLEWVENRFLDSSGTLIQCANHGALFVIQSGLCVAGPCAGRKLEAIPHEVINNELWITMSSPGVK